MSVKRIFVEKKPAFAVQAKELRSEIENYLVPGVKLLKRPEYLDTQEATPQNIISEFIRSSSSDIYTHISLSPANAAAPERFEENTPPASSGGSSPKCDILYGFI